MLQSYEYFFILSIFVVKIFVILEIICNFALIVSDDDGKTNTCKQIESEDYGCAIVDVGSHHDFGLCHHQGFDGP